VGEEGDIAIGVLAVDDLGAWRAGDAQSFQACRDATVRPDFDWGADAPDVSPPRAAGRRAQDILLCLLSPAGGSIWAMTDCGNIISFYFQSVFPLLAAHEYSCAVGLNPF
jgi:hypothetical protein